MMYSRREFGTLTLAGLALPRWAIAADSKVGGVQLGVQTYSFRDLRRTSGGDAVDAIIQAMTACGIGECELFAPQVEPQFPAGRGQRGGPPSPEALKAREDMHCWRLATPLDHFRAIRKKFDAAGIAVYAYNYSPNTSYSDEEIDRGFEMAKALGAGIITASTTLDVAKRIAPFAERHRMAVAMHGHSNISDPNEFATPESFTQALAMSTQFQINLDIGHFTAANYDAVAYLKEHHTQIPVIHLKDRKKNQGPNTPWGEGDTPIKEVLQMLKREKWPIRALVEYEYRGTSDSVTEVKKCVEFCKAALA